MTQAASLSDQILVVFDKLIDGSLSPKEASDWAALIIHEDKEATLPDGCGHALATIGLADTREPDGQFLYGIADFEEWRDEISRELSRKE
ncbi:hypothetical protein AEAC466_09070 [Asticcacaulis sp. AC466]|uniref:hypothetical protein n=1 Tax=Asticcacaulis sp. AC466 TaxID=1282362 RepID=UPI0003C40B47|nr:hypothetical protein [Asticcacaulis sp. AC466]ESQ84492.1 hypothetical protein AEAC466_09070 [Asticcacaulis sp. AC466]